MDNSNNNNNNNSNNSNSNSNNRRPYGLEAQPVLPEPVKGALAKAIKTFVALMAARMKDKLDQQILIQKLMTCITNGQLQPKFAYAVEVSNQNSQMEEHCTMYGTHNNIYQWFKTLKYLFLGMGFARLPTEEKVTAGYEGELSSGWPVTLHGTNNKQLPVGTNCANKSSHHITLVCGSCASGEPIPPHFQVESLAKDDANKLTQGSFLEKLEHRTVTVTRGFDHVKPLRAEQFAPCKGALAQHSTSCVWRTQNSNHNIDKRVSRSFFCGKIEGDLAPSVAHELMTSVDASVDLTSVGSVMEQLLHLELCNSNTVKYLTECGLKGVLVFAAKTPQNYKKEKIASMKPGQKFHITVSFITNSKGVWKTKVLKERREKITATKTRSHKNTRKRRSHLLNQKFCITGSFITSSKDISKAKLLKEHRGETATMKTTTACAAVSAKKKVAAEALFAKCQLVASLPKAKDDAPVTEITIKESLLGKATAEKPTRPALASCPTMPYPTLACVDGTKNDGNNQDGKCRNNNNNNNNNATTSTLTIPTNNTHPSSTKHSPWSPASKISYTSGIFAKAARQAQHDDNDGIPINTQLAYGQKGEEFLHYCTSLFSSCGYSTQIVTKEKVFGFLFYQAYQHKGKEATIRSDNNPKRKFLTSTTTMPTKTIKAFLFSKHWYKHNYHIAALRDRFCFLMMHCGVMRSESLFKCELSDLCSIIKSDEDAHSCLIFMMQIMTGKTDHQKTLYGHVLRHRDANMCPNGHPITDQAYAKTMRTAFKALGVISKHFAHFGRSTGAVAYKMQERRSIFVKTPNEGDAGSFFLPHGTIDPPPELCCQVFPFLDKAMDTIKNVCKKPTAQTFFKLLLNLQFVALQDAAVLIHNGSKIASSSTCPFSTPNCSTLIKQQLWERLLERERRESNVSKDVIQIDAKVSKFEEKQDAINGQLHHFLQHMASFHLPTEAEATTRA
eukprot:jgi/Psemu1/16486/gm1.16486_g